MLLNSDSLDKTLSFNSIADEEFMNYKFVDILSAATVMALKFDAPAKHTQYMPYITDGTPDDYTKYKYAKFLASDGSTLYMGIPWIRAASIVENSAPVRLIRLPAGVTDTQMDTVKSILLASGITGFTVTTL